VKNEKIREDVAAAYAEALRRSRAQGGCCGGSSGPVEPAGIAAKSAGYEAELEAHPEAGRSSCGCGNPLAFAEVGEGQTVVDLGSGAGLDLLIAAEKVGTGGLVVGIDMTDDMIEAARGNAARAGFENVEVRKGVIEALPVEDSSADWVISNCVVNLSPEKERVFAEIHRVLRPGGRFSISDIVVEDLPRAVRELAGARVACVGGAISEAEYVAGLHAAGLEDVRVSERLAYTADQIREALGGDADRAGEEAKAAGVELFGLEGRVASVRLSGRKPG
jgi:SAM-dependent methyltransferase